MEFQQLVSEPQMLNHLKMHVDSKIHDFVPIWHIRARNHLTESGNFSGFIFSILQNYLFGGVVGLWFDLNPYTEMKHTSLINK